jgi:hypothetical protein
MAAGAQAQEGQKEMTSLAYHGPVRLLSWSESSAQEFKFKLELLDGRNALAHFENVTRRSGKRAGQRYRAVWQSDRGKEIAGPAELWFCGADWSHQSGATLRFTVHPEDVAWVRAQPTLDVDELAPKVYLGLVQLDVDDRPIDPEKAAMRNGPRGSRAGRSRRTPRATARTESSRRSSGTAWPQSAGDARGVPTSGSSACATYPRRNASTTTIPRRALPVWETYEARVLVPS